MHDLKSTYEYIDGSIKFNNVVVSGVHVLFSGYTSSIPPITKFPIGGCYLSIQNLDSKSFNLEKTKQIDFACLGDNLWYGNIGHAIFDGLYPIYLSMIKFKDEDKNFTYICNGWNNTKTLSTEFLNIFSGNEIVNPEKYNNEPIFCKTLISGCGFDKSLAGNCVINEKYKTYGQEEYNGFTLLKKRLFQKFNLISDKPVNKTPKVIIIWNKRFSDFELSLLNKLVSDFKDKINIKLINWYHDYLSFYDQMKEYEDVDIQITGPGTGMLYVPFLKTGAVNINLGYMDCTQTNTSRPNIFIKDATKNHCIPGWMEQAICNASNYVTSLYYDRYNKNLLEYNELCNILTKAISLLGTTNYQNLNTDALIFKEYCRRCDHSKKITKYLSDMSLFIEFFVNEHPLAIPEYIDLNLLRQIKSEYGYGNNYSIIKNGI